MSCIAHVPVKELDQSNHSATNPWNCSCHAAMRLDPWRCFHHLFLLCICYMFFWGCAKNSSLHAFWKTAWFLRQLIHKHVASLGLHAPKKATGAKKILPAWNLYWSTILQLLRLLAAVSLQTKSRCPGHTQLLAEQQVWLGHGSGWTKAARFQYISTGFLSSSWPNQVTKPFKMLRQNAKGIQRKDHSSPWPVMQRSFSKSLWCCCRPYSQTAKKKFHWTELWCGLMWHISACHHLFASPAETQGSSPPSKPGPEEQIDKKTSSFCPN